jgi:hypothetical protein
VVSYIFRHSDNFHAGDDNFMVDTICGDRNLYRHKDLPDALRRIADKIPKKKGNPHRQVYDVGDLENVISFIEDELNISIKLVYAKRPI